MTDVGEGEMGGIFMHELKVLLGGEGFVREFQMDITALSEEGVESDMAYFIIRDQKILDKFHAVLEEEFGE